jgi:hypothetical protein
MKTRFTALLMLPLLLLYSTATGQAERTFVKSFNLMGRQTVVLNLGDNIKVTPWDNDVMRIQMTVALPSTNDATLKALAESGRYALKSDLDLQNLIVTAPNVRNTVKVNGTELKETLSFTVFVPKSVTVLRNSEANAKIVAKLNP